MGKMLEWTGSKWERCYSGQGLNRKVISEEVLNGKDISGQVLNGKYISGQGLSGKDVTVDRV